MATILMVSLFTFSCSVGENINNNNTGFFINFLCKPKLSSSTCDTASLICCFCLFVCFFCFILFFSLKYNTVATNVVSAPFLKVATNITPLTRSYPSSVVFFFPPFLVQDSYSDITQFNIIQTQLYLFEKKQNKLLCIGASYPTMLDL